jgi:hypothetical protein
MGTWEDTHALTLGDLANTEPIVSEPVQLVLDDLIVVQRYEVEILSDAAVENPATATASDVLMLAHANRQRGCSVCGHDMAAHANICVPRTAHTKRRSRYNAKRSGV